MERGYASPYWLTFNQAVKLGAHVRKGERGEVVVYYGQGTRKRVDEGGAEVEDAVPLPQMVCRLLRRSDRQSAGAVSSGACRCWSCCRSLRTKPGSPNSRSRASLTRDIACYIPSHDVIGMPPIAAFDTAEDYAATLNHESVHATMAPHRVGRDMGKKFSQHAIAAEELVAEIGASLLGRASSAAAASHPRPRFLYRSLDEALGRRQARVSRPPPRRRRSRSIGCWRKARRRSPRRRRWRDVAA